MITLLQNFLEYKNGIYEDIPFKKELKKLKVDHEIVFDAPLDELALREFGTEDLYWVIGLYNDILDGLNYDGRILKIPNKNDLFMFLSKG